MWPQRSGPEVPMGLEPSVWGLWYRPYSSVTLSDLYHLKSIETSALIPQKLVSAGHSVTYRVQTYATSRKVVCSILDEVIGFFKWSNLYSRTMAPGYTPHLKEMSTSNLPGSKGRQACKADNLTAVFEQIVYKIWDSRRLSNLWVSTDCYRDRFTLLFFYRRIFPRDRVAEVWNSLLISIYCWGLEKFLVMPL
jgi:hypothetical protein